MRRGEIPTMLVLAAGAAAGGGAFVVGHLAVSTTPPAAIAALRYVLALLLFAALLTRLGTRLRRPGRGDLLRLAGMGASVVAGYNLLFLEGLRLAPAADGGLIVPGSAPAFSLLLAWLLLRERPRPRAALGSLAAAAGILLIFIAVGGFSDGSGSRRLGELLYLAGGSMWGLFNVLARGLGGRVGPVEANTYAAGFGLALLAPATLVLDGPRAILAIPPAGLLEIAYLAVFATVLLLWANVRGVARLGVARAAPFAYFAPLAAVVGGVLVLRESVTVLELLGGGMALLGTATASTSWRPRRRPAKVLAVEAAR